MVAICENTMLTDADRAVWASYTRLVSPLPGHERPELPASEPSAAAPASPRNLAAPPPRTRAAAFPVAIGSHPPGVDSSTWHRFRTGKLPVSRTLDLHGHTAQGAFHVLGMFLRAAHSDRLRCVEVITGRGSSASGGVLQRELPLWLNLPELRPFVLAAAHPHAANPGAVRLLLRRQR